MNPSAALPLTVISQTKTKLVLGWPAQPGAEGFEFLVDGKRSNTWTGSLTQATFSGTAKNITVNALGVTASGTWPAVAPPVPAPTPSPSPTPNAEPSQGFSLSSSFAEMGASGQNGVLDKIVEALNGKQGWTRNDWWPNTPGANTGIAAAKSRGLTVMGLFNLDYSNRGSSSQYAADCAALAALPNVDLVNTGNEFDMSGWPAQDYVTFAVAAYKAIGGKKPVVAPSIAKTPKQTGSAMLAYVQAVITVAKGQKFGDYLALSVYGDRLDPNTGGDWNPWPYMSKIRALLDSSGYQSMGIWPVEGGDNADVNGTTMQANAVKNGLNARADGVPIVSFGVYTMRNDTDAPGFGLLDNNGNERPGFAAFKAGAAWNEPDPNGLHVFRIAAQYLKENAWYRDADDPGIWWSITCTGTSFGDALELQLERDGMSMETV